MGLGYVELVMDVEDRFGLEVPDSDLEQLATVGAWHEYLCRRLEAPAAAVCFGRAAFVTFRDAFAPLFGLNPREIRPRRRLVELVGQRVPKRQWRQLSQRLGWQLPELVATLPAHKTSWGGVIVVATVAIVPFLFLESALLAWLVGVTGALVAFALRLEPPDTMDLPMNHTVRDLVEQCVLLNPRRLDGSAWTRQEVWLVLKRIIVNKTDAPAAHVRPQAHLVCDLGLD